MYVFLYDTIKWPYQPKGPCKFKKKLKRLWKWVGGSSVQLEIKKIGKHIFIAFLGKHSHVNNVINALRCLCSCFYHSLLILSLITRWLAILAFSSYRGIVWTHNHYAGLRSDTHIRCLWSLQWPLIININFTQCYARYYQYFTCRCCYLR